MWASVMPKYGHWWLGQSKPSEFARSGAPRRLLTSRQGRTGKVLGCRALVVLHDKDGHPLLVTIHRGDQHLTLGLPAILAHYERADDPECGWS